MVIIRGYGDIGYPWICTFYQEAAERDAVTVIEEFLQTLPDKERERYEFQVRTEDDLRHLQTTQKPKSTVASMTQ